MRVFIGLALLLVFAIANISAAKKLENNTELRNRTSDNNLAEDRVPFTEKNKGIHLEDTFKTNTKNTTRQVPILGAFGFVLGAKFNTTAAGVSYDEETQAYDIATPQKPFRKWFRYHVMITPETRKICCISAFFETEDEVAFNAEKELVLKLLKDKYSAITARAGAGGGPVARTEDDELFYYMDPSGCFVSLSFCESSDGIKMLRLKYASMPLIDIMDKEKLKKIKAQDGNAL